MSRGILFVLSGPSGVGKGTVRAELFSRANHKLVYSVSATTRIARKGEVEGVDYFFKTQEEFEKMIANRALIEYAQFVGNYYGTPLDYVEKMLDEGQDVILEIEVQGATQVKRLLPEAVFIFLAPPSLKELRRRLVGRGTEDTEVISGRINTAIRELFLMSEYDYTVINDTVEQAADKIIAIIKAEHLRTKYIESTIRERIMEELV
ncbi:guanylate kinase [Erysipelotrichaceae bacterium]|nr:guanylate kinase [Erysipelotrichaceae bacterium]